VGHASTSGRLRRGYMTPKGSMIFASKPWVASLSVWASKLRSDISVDKRHHHKAWVKAKQNHKDMGSVG
jgi:hypothetical protein